MSKFLDYDIESLGKEEASEQPQGVNPGAEEPIDLNPNGLAFSQESEEAQKEPTVISGGVFAGNEQDLSNEASRQRNQMLYGNTGHDKSDQEYQEAWTTDYTTMDLSKKAKRSLVAGVGQISSEIGDLLQFAGAAIPGIEMYEDNLLSKYFHDLGNEIEDENVIRQSAALGDKFSWAHLGNMEFWMTDVAKQVPNLAFMVATSAIGGGLATSAFKTAVNAGIKKGAIKGTKSIAGKFSASGLNIAGTGLAGKLTSATATKMAGAVGGGLTMNMLNGSMIAGDAVNRAKELGLTNEQAAMVGANVFLDNSKWVLADMVSWGMTFGGFNKGINRALNKVGPQQAMRVADKISLMGFRGTATGLKGLIKTGKVAGQMSLEGIEEQFQEVYEEWVTRKNIAEAQGEEFDDYFDFFNSEEMQKTRGIAFAAGLLGASVPTMINEIAESSRVGRNKEDYLKERFEKGDDATMQRSIIQDALATIALSDQAMEFNSFLTDHENKGVINAEEKAAYLKEAEEFEKMYIASQQKATDGHGRLNEKGAHYLFSAMVDQRVKEEERDNIIEKGKKTLAQKLEGIDDEQTRAEITEQFNDAHEEEVAIANAYIDSLKKIQRDFVTGKKAKGLPKGYKQIANRIVIDEESNHWNPSNVVEWGADGKRIGEKPESQTEMLVDIDRRSKGMSERQFNEFTQEGSKLNKENLQSKAKTVGDQAVRKGKGLFGKLMDTVKSKLGMKVEERQEDNFQEDNSGEFENFVPVKNVTEIKGDSFTDTDGTTYERTESGFVRKNKDGKEMVLSGEEATEAYNRIGEEQAKRNAAKKGSGQESGKGKVNDIKDMPGSFNLKGTSYRVNKDGSYTMTQAVQGQTQSGNIDPAIQEEVLQAENDYNKAVKSIEEDNMLSTKEKEEAKADALKTKEATQQTAYAKSSTASATDSKTTISAKRAMEIYNGAVDQDTLENEILTEFAREVEEAENDLEGADENYIKKYLNRLKKRFKKKYGDKFNSVEGKINEMMNEAKSSLKGVGFGTLEGFKQRTEAREKARLAGETDAEIEAVYDLYGVSLDLNAFGGLSELNRKIAESVPPYNGDNSLFLINKGHQINKEVRAKFGDGVNVFLLDNINDRAGHDAVAMALGSTVFITPDSFRQPEQLFHEVLHVHYALNPNDPDVKAMTDRAMGNEKTVKQLMKDYASQVIYKITPNFIEIGEGPINTRVYKNGDELKTGEGRVIEKGSVEHVSLMQQFEPFDATAMSEGVDSSIMISGEAYSIEQLPMEEQSIIREEAYAHRMQKVVAEENDIYFSPKEKRREKSRSAKMWTKFRSRINKKYAKELAGVEFEEEANAKILSSLGKMDTSGSESFVGGARFLNPYSPAQQSEISDSVDNGKMAREIKRVEDKKQGLVDQSIIPADEAGEIDEETMLESEDMTSTVLNLADRKSAESKTTQRTVVNFLKAYNQDLAKQDETQAREIVTKKDLVVPLRLRAKKQGREEFILGLRESNYPPIMKFIAYLDKINEALYGSDAQSVTNAQLADMHKMYSNAVQEAPYQMMVSKNKDGSLSIQNEALLTASETQLSDTLENNFFNLAMAGKRKRNTTKFGINEKLRAERKQEILQEAAEWKNSKNPSYESTLNLFKSLFPSSTLDHEGIMEESLFYNGKKMPFFEAFKSFVNDTTAMKNLLLAQNMKSKKLIAKPFIRSIIAANRKHTLNDQVMNPENNPTSTYNKTNFVRSFEARMNKNLDSIRANNGRFIKKGGALMEMLGNHYLDTGGISLESFAGVRNLAMGQNQKYSNMNENSFVMTTLLRYLSDESDSYMQTLGTAADSNNHYTSRVPKHSRKSEKSAAMAREVNEFTGREIFTFDKNGNVDKNSGEFRNDLKETFMFWQENQDALKSYGDLKLTNDSNSKVNNQIADAIFSNIVNKVAMQKLMFGQSANKGNFTKRFKNANSPVVPYRAKTKMDMLAVLVPKMAIVEKNGEQTIILASDLKKDQKHTILETSDGDSYITPNGAAKLKHEYGDSMNLKDAGAFKTMSFDYNREGTDIEQMKTMTFVLTDELVKENPILGAIRKTLDARERLHGADPDYFGIAATTDALKQFNKDHVYDIEKGIKESSNDSLQADLEIEMEDSMAYHNDVKGVFAGHQSTTFGVMQEMDMGSTRSTMPTQLWANLLMNSDAGSEFGIKAKKIQQKAMDLMMLNLETEVLQKLKTKNIEPRMEDMEKIAQFVHNAYENNDKVNALQKSMAGIKSLNIPYLNEDAYNHIANTISRAGNKLVTDGGYAFQTSELGTMKVDASNDVTFSQTMKNNEAAIPFKMAMELGLKPGDKFLASRIPHHGLQTTAVFEVKEIMKSSNGSSIIVNSQFTNIIGADHDGDALFINARPTAKMFEGKNGLEKKKLHMLTELIDDISKMLLDPKLEEDVKAAMDPKTVEDTAFEPGEYAEAKKRINEELSGVTLWGEARTYNENVPFKKMVGIAAQIHRMGNLLRSYNIVLKKPINVGGGSKSEFKNNGKRGAESTAFQSALLMNIILDNQSNQMGTALGISTETIEQYALMINMGYSFKDVKNFMAKPGVKAWERVSANRSNAMFEESSKSDMIDKANHLIKTNPKLSTIEKTEAYAHIEQMAYLDSVSNDLMKISTIISGHKKLNGDYQLLSKQRAEMDNVLSNSETMTGLGKLRTSPEVARYIRVADEMLDIHKRTNIMASPEINTVYGKIVNSTSDSHLGGEKGRSIKDNVMKALAVDIARGNKPTVQQVNEATDVIQAAKVDPRVGKNPFMKIFSIRDGKIYFSPTWRNPDNLTTEDVDYMKYWYARLPVDVKTAFFNYDMMNNGFAGYNSIVPFFDNNQRNILEKGGNRLSLAHTRGNAMRNTGRNIALLNSENFPQFPSKNLKASTLDLNESIMKKNASIKKNALANKAHYITVPTSKNLKTKSFEEHIVFEYVPLDAQEFEDLKNTSLDKNGNFSEKILAEEIAELGQYRRIGKRNLSDVNNTWMLEDNTPPPSQGLDTQEKLKSALRAKKKTANSGPRFLKSSTSDPKFVSGLTFEEWLSENNRDSSEQAKAEYDTHRKEFDKYKALADGEYSPSSIRKKSTESLVKLYEQLLQKTFVDVAPLVNEITPELHKRETAAFMKKNGIAHWDKKHDISGAFKWAGSDNVSQRKPDLQALYYRLNTEYAKLERAMDEELTEINKITDALIKSKLGGPEWVKWLKGKFIKYFGTRNIYDHLYGNLVTVEKGRDEKGRPYKNMRLKTQEEIDAMQKPLTRAEKNFYVTFKNYTKKYGDIAKANQTEFKTRQGYIPHMSAHLLEAYSARGLMGAYLVSKSTSLDPDARAVVITAQDPLSSTKSMKTAPLSYFEEAYKKKDNFFNVKGVYEFNRLKNRAERLLRKGINEDGSQIEMDYVSRDTMLNGSWMDRFTSKRSVRATDLPSLDLNHALTSYVKASMWKYGNKKVKTAEDFQGFDKMSALIDGIIRLNQKHGNANTAELVQKVSWDKLMMGKNQTSFLGKKGDMAVDALNWLTTVMALGFKMGIAKGNIIFGKYSNIRAEGGRQWANGELRYWGFNSDNLKTTTRKGQAILNRYQLIDKSRMYDIGWSNKKSLGGFFTDKALTFMTLSENWIQGAHFLGMLSEEEWNSYDDEGNLKPGKSRLTSDRVASIESDVRRIHGRGYSATDQRMIGLYSLGRSMQMFKKWLITNYDERFGEEIQNIYGKKQIGSMRQFGNVILAGFRGEISEQGMAKYYDSLPAHQKKAFKSAVRGISMLFIFGLAGMMLGDSEPEKELKKNLRKLSSDANTFYSTDKIGKVSRIYPYQTAKYVAKVGSSALSFQEAEEQQTI